MRQILFAIILIYTNVANGQGPNEEVEFNWPNNEALAVSLSYDDALASQLDHALPALNHHGLRGSFYILPNSKVIRERREEWRTLARQGHELGNHSVFHPCRASLPGREWVANHRDLDNYTVDQMKEEISTANTILHAIDGEEERTLTPPCGDRLAGGEDYIPLVSDMFVAIKPLKAVAGFSATWSPTGVTGQQLIDYVRRMEGQTRMVNILFHGVGGDYLSVESDAHGELLQYLSENRDRYWVDSFINIMRYVKQKDGSLSQVTEEHVGRQQHLGPQD
jgi:peptidoglycan/xylan/chitin deacetylase (PgdA/CDA1 family)